MEMQRHESTDESDSFVYIKNWILSEADFICRTDEEFLLMFVRGCKMDVEKMKKKLAAFYESRRKIPKWWTNRDICDPKLSSLAERKITTTMRDSSANLPSVTISVMSNLGPFLNNFDDYAKLHSMCIEVTLRRPNGQHNGHVWIADFKNCPTWFFLKMSSIPQAYNIFKSFYLALPLRIKSIHALNTNIFMQMVWHALVKAVAAPKIAKRVFFYGSDFTSLSNHVPIELLPTEYGGTAGPLEHHQNSYLDEIKSFNEYFLTDSKYGMKRSS